MAYDDGYYYGQCKIVAVVDNAADNGKTVLITTDDNKTYSGTIANKKCEFLLPPRTLYTVQKVSSGSAEFTTKVEAGYGDCILVHLDTGYVEVKQGDIVGLDYIKAATADDLKNKVPEANAVKELNDSLSFPDGVGFYPDVQDGVRGYNTSPERGADTFSPFKRGIVVIGTYSGNKTINVSSYNGYENFTKDNFIIEILSCSADSTVLLTLSKVIQKSDKLQGKIFGCTVSKTYDASTGVLKVSGMSNTVHIVNENGTKKANCASFTKYRVLLV